MTAEFRTDVFHFLDKESFFLRGVLKGSNYLSNGIKHISNILHLAHTHNREVQAVSHTMSVYSLWILPSDNGCCTITRSLQVACTVITLSLAVIHRQAKFLNGLHYKSGHNLTSDAVFTLVGPNEFFSDVVVVPCYCCHLPHPPVGKMHLLH